MFVKLNIYDQLGYLLVGSLAIILIYIDATLLKYNFIFTLNTKNFIILTLIAYFLGHIFQAFSNFFIKWNRIPFKEDEKTILQLARKNFKLQKEFFDDFYVWELCYILTLQNDNTNQIAYFNAYYGLYRGWFVVFICHTIFIIILCLITKFNIYSIFLVCFSLLFAIIFFKRSKRFFFYFRKRVLQNFYITILNTNKSSCAL